MVESPTNDWQSGKSLSECLDYVFTSCIASDVTFVVGESKKRVQAHKLVLLSRSPVFYAMFEGPMAEKGAITIPDITEETFSFFLRYLYTDKVNITVVNVVPLMSVARKYCVDVLTTICEEFLEEHLNSENACLLLEQSHIFLEDKLKNDCLKIIGELPEDALKSGTFKELCADCVLSIVQSDDLGIEESNVYYAVTEWSEAECNRRHLDVSPQNRRNVLGDILFAVRFTLMDTEFLLDKVCNDEILSSDLFVEVINYQRHSKIRSDSRLKVKSRKTQVSERFWRIHETVERMWNSTPIQEAISFSVSHRLRLHGIGSYITGREPSYISIEIFEEENLLYQDGEATLHQAVNTIQPVRDVILTKQLLIEPKKTYTIVEISSAPKLAFGESGVNEAKFKEVIIWFRKSKKSVHTNIHRGQIPYLILSK